MIKNHELDSTSNIETQVNILLDIVGQKSVLDHKQDKGSVDDWRREIIGFSQDREVYLYAYAETVSRAFDSMIGIGKEIDTIETIKTADFLAKVAVEEKGVPDDDIKRVFDICTPLELKPIIKSDKDTNSKQRTDFLMIKIIEPILKDFVERSKRNNWTGGSDNQGWTGS